MKELSIEEKAKRYDEALDNAKVVYKTIRKDLKPVIEQIFTELKESKDERIRGKLIELFHDTVSNDEIFSDYGLDKTEVLDWLEKQGKSESESLEEKIDNTNKVEPKFKVGDWIIDKQGLVHQIENVVENVTNHTFGYDIVGGGYFNDNSDVRLWTIEDAKDGDVLSYVTDEEDLWIMIFQSLYEPYINHVHYRALLVNDNFTEKGTCCIDIDYLKPATKEQRDKFEKAMLKAGYKWNTEERKLEKI